VDSKTYLIKSGTQEIGKFICLCEFLRSTFNPLCFLVFALNFGSGLSGLGLLQFIDGDAVTWGGAKSNRGERRIIMLRTQRGGNKNSINFMKYISSVFPVFIF
jgi:hypothetical protein